MCTGFIIAGSNKAVNIQAADNTDSAGCKKTHRSINGIMFALKSTAISYKLEMKADVSMSSEERVYIPI